MERVAFEVSSMDMQSDDATQYFYCALGTRLVIVQTRSYYVTFMKLSDACTFQPSRLNTISRSESFTPCLAVGVEVRRLANSHSAMTRTST